MAKGLSIYIGADTKDAITEVGKLGDGMADLQDELGQTVKDSAQLERKFSDDMRDMSQASEKTGRSIGNDITKGTRKASEGVDTLKQESKQNAEEIASSFDGSAESIADGFQSIAATAFAGFGPAGIVAGLAAAAGLGLVSAAITDAQQEADELKERLSSAYRAAAEEGRTFLDELQIQAALADIVFDTEKAAKYKEDARLAGVDWQTYFRAMAGDAAALNTVSAAGAQAEKDRLAVLSEINTGQNSRLNAADKELNKLEELNGRLAEEKQLHQDNLDAANEMLVLQGQSAGQIIRRNEELAKTPATVKTTLEVDDTALNRALAQNREIRVTVNGYSREGQRVI